MSDDLSKQELQGLFDGAMELVAGAGLQEQLSSSEDRYEKLGEFGTGARKRVIHARDRFTGREIALATLKPPVNDEVSERFLREARMLAQLQHPAIIPVYDVGISDEFGPYFVMKPAESKTFETIVKSLRGARENTATRWPLALRLDLFARVCQGIAYAHNHGILHLDLKPANILLGRFGEALVSDWGIARKLDDPEEMEFFEDEELESSRVKLLTKHGMVRGTPGYMAPEQMLAEETTCATDVYGLGGILYALLTSLPPISGANFEQIEHATLQGSIVPPSIKRPDLGIPSSLDAIVMKALARDPLNRYPTATDFLADLEQFRSGYAPNAYDASTLDHAKMTYARNKNLIHGLLATGLLLIATSAIFIRQLQAKQRTAVAAQKEAVDALKIAEVQNEKNEQLVQALQEAQIVQNEQASELAIRFVDDAKKALKEPDYRRARKLLNSAVNLSPTLESARQLRGDLNVAAMDLTQAAADYQHLSRLPHNSLNGIVQLNLDLLDKQSDAADLRIHRGVWIALAARGRKDLLQAAVDFLGDADLSEHRNAELRVELIKVLNPKQKKWVTKIESKEKGIYVDLSNHNNLTNVAALKGTTIFHLDLSGSKVQANQLALLRTTQIQSLTYQRAPTVYSKELALPNLRFADFSHSKLKWVSALAVCPLEVLNVSHTPVGDFASLVPCETLHTLHVSRKQAPKAKALKPKVTIKISR